MKEELTKKYIKISDTITTKSGSVRNDQCQQSITNWRDQALKEIKDKQKSDSNVIQYRNLWDQLKQELKNIDDSSKGFFNVNINS